MNIAHLLMVYIVLLYGSLLYHNNVKVKNIVDTQNWSLLLTRILIIKLFFFNVYIFSDFMYCSSTFNQALSNTLIHTGTAFSEVEPSMMSVSIDKTSYLKVVGACAIGVCVGIAAANIYKYYQTKHIKKTEQHFEDKLNELQKQLDNKIKSSVDDAIIKQEKVLRESISEAIAQQKVVLTDSSTEAIIKQEKILKDSITNVTLKQEKVLEKKVTEGVAEGFANFTERVDHLAHLTFKVNQLAVSGGANLVTKLNTNTYQLNQSLLSLSDLSEQVRTQQQSLILTNEKLNILENQQKIILKILKDNKTPKANMLSAEEKELCECLVAHLEIEVKEKMNFGITSTVFEATELAFVAPLAVDITSVAYNMLKTTLAENCTYQGVAFTFKTLYQLYDNYHDDNMVKSDLSPLFQMFAAKDQAKTITYKDILDNLFHFLRSRGYK